MSINIKANWKANRTRADVTVHDEEDGKLLAADSINPYSQRDRKRLAESVGEVTAGRVDPDVVEQRLMALCEQQEAAADDGKAGEVELVDGQVIRPDCFHLGDLSGISVARQLLKNGEPHMDWVLYVRHADGGRVVQELKPYLQLDERRLYVRPVPPAPYPGMAGGWSPAGRNQWLAGRAEASPEKFYSDTAAALARFLDLPPDTAAGTISTLICWVTLTYIFPAFSAVPYLLLSGPAGSGKSRVLELLERLAFKPFSASNLTNAVLFRSLNSFGGTLLLDEAEQLRDNRSPEVKELMSSLLAGYRSGKFVCRMEPTAEGGFSLSHFAVYGPKAIACINEVPAPLAQRCIQIPMFRSPPGSDKPRQRLEAFDSIWQALRDAAHAIALDFGCDWPRLASLQDVCPEMSGRNYELWQPLLAIASWFEDHGVQGLLSFMQGHALAAIDSVKDQSTPADDELLLRTLARAVFRGDRPTAKDVLAAASLEEPTTFQRWSPKAVAAHLRRYGLIAMKSHGRHEYKPSNDDLARIETNYGIDLGLEDEAIPA
jgi:hypothetical protein